MKCSIRWITSYCLITSMALIGSCGCGNPADDVAPARVSDARPVNPDPAIRAKAGAPTAPTPTASAAATKDTAPSDLPKDSALLKFGPETSKLEFIGSKVTGKHTGEFKSFLGTWALVPTKPEASKIKAEIDMDSVVTDTPKLTGHLKSPDFFDVAKHPKSTFELTEITSGASSEKLNDATHTVTGNLTLHGVTKSIQFPAKIAVTPEAATLESEFFLNREDFGIKYPGMPNDLIRKEVVIKLAIRAPKKA